MTSIIAKVVGKMTSTIAKVVEKNILLDEYKIVIKQLT